MLTRPLNKGARPVDQSCDHSLAQNGARRLNSLRINHSHSVFDYLEEAGTLD